MPLELAYIAPLAESEWWRRNRMALFTCRPEASSDINCIENALLLRELKVAVDPDTDGLSE